MNIAVEIRHIYSSPEHNYFTREKFDTGKALSREHERVELEPDRGIKGDRFEFSQYPLTFVCEEVMREVCQSLELEYLPSLFRRNIVMSGINLNQLIAKRFFIGDVEFEGLEHCAPCTWMNAVMKKGAYRLMSGRGGLRARVMRSGSLHRGTNTLITKDNFELLDPLAAGKRPKIPH